MASATFSIILLIILTLAACIEGSGKIAVKVTSYSNPGGRRKDGNCCDGVSLAQDCPTGFCDNSYTLCASSKNNSVDDNDCDYGKQKFDGPKDQNSNNFTEEDVALFVFDTWTGSVRLVIRVTDLDADGEEDIDTFSVTFTSPVFTSDSTSTYRDFQLTGIRQTNPTSLSVSVTAYCERYYYTADCSKRCVRQDNCQGHYTCSKDGDMMCDPGWKGDNCQQQIPGSHSDCRIYDEKDLGKSSWSGNATCNDSAQPIGIDFTGNGGISGSLTIQGEIVHVYGLFNTTTEEMSLASNRGNTSHVSIQSIMVTRINHTALLGTMILNGENCDINLIKTSGTPGACGYDGTCVRYGIQVHDYYCCCNDGSTGNKCATTTTVSTTKTTVTTTTSTTKRISTEVKTEGDTNTPTVNSVSMETTTPTVATVSLKTEAMLNTSGPSQESDSHVCFKHTSCLY